MSLRVVLFLAILGLPLAGAALGLFLHRFVHRRLGVLLAALFLCLSAVAVVMFVQFPSLDAEDLTQPLPSLGTPAAGIRMAPTVPWVQPPRTLGITVTLAPPITPIPTVEPTATPTPNPLAGVTVAVRNGSQQPGLAGRTADRLESEGFTIVEIENDRLAGERPHTLILDRGDHPDVREALAASLGIAPEYVEINSDEPGGDADADIIVVLGDDFRE